MRPFLGKRQFGELPPRYRCEREPGSRNCKQIHGTDGSEKAVKHPRERIMNLILNLFRDPQLTEPAKLTVAAEHSKTVDRGVCSTAKYQSASAAMGSVAFKNHVENLADEIRKLRTV